MATPDLTEGIKWYLVFVFSTTLHEAAHAWTALKLGDDTAHRGGQVTLDPTPHVQREPFGMVVVPILSYILGGWMIGWASAPYDPEWALRHPRRAAWMSLAGPASNFLLVVLAALAIRAGILANVFEAPDHIGFTHIVDSIAPGGLWLFAAKMLSICFSLNLLLCTFNLLPLPPLDGSGALMLFMNEEMAAKYSEFIRHPSLSWIGLMIGWRFFGSFFPVIQIAAVNLLYPTLNYHY